MKLPEFYFKSLSKNQRKLAGKLLKEFLINQSKTKYSWSALSLK